jgi:FtsP/CotA-like multicopper oxidase with cupredoxin domain
VSAQYIDGIVGPLVVHAPEERQLQQQMYDFDQVILIQDWYHDLSSSLLDQYLSSGNENSEPVPDNGLVQGTNYFNCSSYDADAGYVCFDNSSRPTFEIEQDKRYRLRFINTGAFTTFEVSIDNHSLAVIEADGTATLPLPVHRFEIATAQRYSVVLNANQTSSTNYWMRTTMITDCYAADNDVLDPNVMALVTYKNNTNTPTASNDWAEAPVFTCQDLNSSLLIPSAAEQAPPASALYQLSFSFPIGNNAEDRASVNGTQWIPNLTNPTVNQAVLDLASNNLSATNAGLVTTQGAFSSNQLVIALPESEPVIDLLVQNWDDGPHPFHLHGHTFWVMATSTTEYFPWSVTNYYGNMNSTATTDANRNPMRRDTITITAFSWVLLRFRNDVPGMWAFHCHNIWHMEAGLLVQLMGLPEAMKAWTLPEDWKGLCSST